MRVRKRGAGQEDPARAAIIERELSIGPMAASILCSRGIDTPEAARTFLYYEDLCDPFGFHGMEEAVALIRCAVEEGKRIVVYGDYDCDGISACAILVDCLFSMGARVEPYIPSRAQEGYGLNLTAMEQICEGTGLVVTVDCGIGSMEEIQYLRDRGVDVVLTDHHTPGEVLPPANVVLNPKVQSPAGAGELCGCGMAFQLARALGADPDAYLPTAAIATIGDIVPLTGENRSIVKRGLRLMNQHPPVFVSALLEEARLHYETITATQVAFMLVPRINAAGRMDDAMLAYRLLLEKTPSKAQEYARTLCGYNAKRQAMEEEILKEALRQLAEHPPRDRRGVYAFGRGWHQGVVGIVASRLTERFGMPAVVGSIDAEGKCTASLRSVGGVDIHHVLTACSELFSRYGGHAQAGGFTMDEENIPAFIQRFEDVLFSDYGREDFMVQEDYDASIGVEDIGLALSGDLALLEPFGCGNPVPVFLLEGAQVENIREFGKTAIHLKMGLCQNGHSAEGILFKAESKGPIYGGQRYRMLGNLELEHFRGNVSANFIIKSAEPYERDLTSRFRERGYDCVKAFLTGTALPMEEIEGEEVTYEDIGFLLEENPFGTLIRSATPMAAMDFCAWLTSQEGGEDLMPEIAIGALSNGQHSRNTLLLAPQQPVSGMERFGRIVYLDGIWIRPEIDSEQEVYDCGGGQFVQRFAREMLLTRERFAAIYREAMGTGQRTHRDLNQLCGALAKIQGENIITVSFAVYQFLQLGFFRLIRSGKGVRLQAVPQKGKLDITATELYRHLTKLAGR